MEKLKKWRQIRIATVFSNVDTISKVLKAHSVFRSDYISNEKILHDAAKVALDFLRDKNKWSRNVDSFYSQPRRINARFG